MKQKVILYLPSLASSVLAFVPPSGVPRVSKSWSSFSISRHNVPVCMSATQPEQVYGLDLTKPKTKPTPEDFVYEHGIPDTPMTRRFGHLRGTSVKTVSETVAEFYQDYTNLIFPQFRTVVTEYLQSTHLTVYDARFKYDPFFGAGLYNSFTRFMRSYPKPEEVENMFTSIVKALGQGLDADKMRGDLKALQEWAAGKTEEDVMTAMMSDDKSDIVTEGFYIARTGLGPFGEGWETKGEDVDWFLYNRMWGVGVFALIEAIGLEPNDELLERWFQKMGTPPQGIMKDLILYQEQLAKLEAAEQLWKEVEIREKKRLAERLEEKAKDAIRQAEIAEKDAQDEREELERIANAKEGDVLPNDLPSE